MSFEEAQDEIRILIETEKEQFQQKNFTANNNSGSADSGYAPSNQPATASIEDSSPLRKRGRFDEQSYGFQKSQEEIYSPNLFETMNNYEDRQTETGNSTDFINSDSENDGKISMNFFRIHVYLIFDFPFLMF